METEKKNDILSKAFSDTQGLISLADSKANISLTVHSILITMTLGVALISGIFEKVNNLILKGNIYGILFVIILIIFIFSSIAGIISTILVFKPRVAQEEGEENRKGFLYFGQILQYKDSNEYLNAIKGLDDAKLTEEYAKQIYQVSKIAKKKFFYVKISILFLLINIIFTVIFLLLANFINLAF